MKRLNIQPVSKNMWLGEDNGKNKKNLRENADELYWKSIEAR